MAFAISQCQCPGIAHSVSAFSTTSTSCTHPRIILRGVRGNELALLGSVVDPCSAGIDPQTASIVDGPTPFSTVLMPIDDQGRPRLAHSEHRLCRGRRRV